MKPEKNLDNLLDTPSGGEPDDFDVPAALRRISADVARIRRGQQPPPGWWAEQDRARTCLETVVSAEINTSRLARIIDLADLLDGHRDPSDQRVEDLVQEIEGFRLFGCLLHYTGHPVSAEFWWKIGAGAGDHTSAWCLYLHHLGRGEIREARLWFEQAVSVDGDLGPGVPRPTVPEMPDYFRAAPIAMDTRVAEPSAPSDVLADEVDRLVMHTGDDTDGLVPYPDRRLAARVEEFAGLR
ncbi:hypothetical protein F7Q99_38430 [Streptomyces kaniharaensis]|uniref:Tetratricopeptide repeat protein n=1 Tax=Streptomyces kaniharaensis TaxID=212423 RepID=A0A6N7L6S5_9ACTN|nr:hypothetical protein [Streptomyces kaniharaensis]MQS17913.1 hypothetical protein [Streptomyces kaniharaensis]